jgi:hypothetical protein
MRFRAVNSSLANGYWIIEIRRKQIILAKEDSQKWNKTV